MPPQPMPPERNAPETKPPEARKDEPKKPLEPPAPGKASDERRAVARFRSRDRVLLAAAGGKPGTWQRVLPDAVVSSTDTLVSLPGYRSDLVTDTGVGLLLWGSLPELLDVPLNEALNIPLYESSVTLRVPPQGFDTDVELHRGRLKLTNSTSRPEAKVRLRFAGEVWDLTLVGDSAELLCDRINRYTEAMPFSPADNAEKPQTELFIACLKGAGRVTIGYRPPFELTPPPGKAWLLWDNKGSGAPEVAELPAAPPVWSDKLPTTEPSKGMATRMQQALTELSQRLSKPGAGLQVALAEARQSPQLASAVLSVFSLSGIDGAAELIDALDDPNNQVIRGVAQAVLRHWCAQRSENDRQLYALLQEDKGYTKGQAEELMQLLHGFPDEDRRNPAIYEKLFDALGSNKLPLRQLAYDALARLDPDGPAKTRFDPAGEPSARELGLDAWKRRIPPGKLPPASAGRLGAR
jgi:hypothetical protein